MTALALAADRARKSLDHLKAERVKAQRARARLSRAEHARAQRAADIHAYI